MCLITRFIQLLLNKNRELYRRVRINDGTFDLRSREEAEAFVSVKLIELTVDPLARLLGRRGAGSELRAIKKLPVQLRGARLTRLSMRETGFRWPTVASLMARLLPRISTGRAARARPVSRKPPVAG